MERQIFFERGKLYSKEEIEKEGLIFYKQLTSGNVVYLKDSFSFWFHMKNDFIRNSSLYEFLSYYSD
jgi:hypothetical protein